MASLWLFIKAVVHHWGVLVTGVGLSLVFGGVEHYRQESLSWKAYCLILAATVFAACFVAWKEQHNITIEKETELGDLRKQLASPEFVVTIGMLANGVIGSRIMVFLTAQISNPHGPQSALFGWEIRLELANGELINQSSPLTPDQNGVNVNIGDTGKAIRLSPDSFFPVFTQPIPPGGFINGWFWGAFENLAQEELYRGGTSAILVFKDAVSQKEHIFRTDFREQGTNWPGVTDTDWIPESALKSPQRVSNDR